MGAVDDETRTAGAAPATDETRDAPWAGQAPADVVHPFYVDDARRYVVGDLLGQGGMGRVVAAEDRRLRRVVALKEVRPGVDGRDRLAQEAWITARLEHPGIVPVHDAGASLDGGLFYTMRLIRGRSLAAALAEAGGLEGRLGLLRAFLAACEAVGYAHGAGVVHRDLKPGNIMLGDFGETHVVDWGLARPVDGSAEAWRGDPLPAGHAARTAYGAVMGTPSYMSPEQAAGAPVDVRADVWSLGAVLFELLTGAPPFTGGDSSVVLERARVEAPPPVRAVAPAAPPELAAIADRALRRDPEARYPTARELAADVGRYFDGRRVHAYDYSSWELARRVARAWRAPLLVAAAALVVVAALTIAGTVRLSGERNRAVAAEADTRAALAQADRQLARSLVWQARLVLEANARPEAEVLAAHALTHGESAEARGVLAAFAVAERPRLRSTAPAPACVRTVLADAGDRLLCLETDGVSLWSTAPLERRWRRAGGARLATFVGPRQVLVAGADGAHVLLDAADGAPRRALSPRSLNFNWTAGPAGRLAVAFNGAHLGAFDVESGEARTRERPCGEADVTAVALSADESLLVVGCSDRRFLVGPPGGEPTRTWTTPFGAKTEVAFSLALAPDARHVVVGTTLGRIAWIDVADGAIRAITAPEAGAVHEVRIAPAGDRVAVRFGRGGVRLWAPRAGAWLSSLPAGASSRAVAFGADGRDLVTVGREVRRWDLPAAFALQRVDLGAGVTSAHPSPDGARMAATRGDGVVSVASIATGEPLAEFAASPGMVVKRGAFSPDGGRYVLAHSRPAGLFVFDTASWTQTAHHASDRAFSYRRVGALRGGLAYGVPFGVNPLHVWRLEDGALTVVPSPAKADTLDASTAPGGAQAVFVDRAGGVHRLLAGDPPRAEALFTVPGGDSIDVTADGATIVVARVDAVLVADAATGTTRRTLPHPWTPIVDVAVSADGRFVATGGVDGSTRVWAARADEPVAVLRGHGERVASVTFEGDDVVMTGSWDGTVRRWGIGVVDVPAGALVDEIGAAWGLTLDDVLAAE